MGVELHHDEAVAEVIREHVRAPRPADGRQQPPSGAGAGRRDDHPADAGHRAGSDLPGAVGGVDKVVFAVPGVPHEMQDMFERAILPDLLRRSGDPSVIVSRVLRTWGESESGLNERLDDVIAELDEPGDPTLAFLASGWEGLKVRLTAKAATPRGGRRSLDEWERRIRSVARRARVRARRRHDGVGRARRDAQAGPDARAGRVGDRRAGVRPADRHRRRQRRAAGFDRVVRERGQVRPARRRRRAGRQRGGGARDGARAPAACSAATSGWR